MTRIYLDVHDRVRVDTSPDGEKARKADFDRAIVKGCDRMIRAAARIIDIKKELGLDTTGLSAAAVDIVVFRAEIICGVA